MKQNTGARLGLLVFVILVAFVAVVPNFINMEKRWWFSKKTINYGLDIRGGLHLVMGVDVRAVREETVARLGSTMKSHMEEESIIVSSVAATPDKKQIKITMVAENDSDRVENFIERFYPNLQTVDTVGNRVTLQLRDYYVQQLKKDTLEQAIEVIQNRINEFGVAEPSITAQGEDRILIQLPGLEKDYNQAKELINRTARLEFKLVSEENTNLAELIEKAEKEGDYNIEKINSYSAYVKRLNEDLKDKLPKDAEVRFAKAENVESIINGKNPYLLESKVAVDGGDLKDASVGFGRFNEPEVNLSFNPQGAKKFGDVTGDNVNRRLAIVLDDVVYSDPRIEGRIGGGNARITLGGARDVNAQMNEAKTISMALRAGALPARLEQLEERTVGPTLGKDSIEKGKIAIMIGGLLVLVFMLIYYKSMGIVADLALGLNIFLILSMLTALGATLTLPGIAGIALTIGMAVDANVIIFERIKEELVKGASLRAAIADGYEKGFSAIFDANVTTAATSIILWYYGTGPVRGFATTLLIGICTSLFCAVFMTRTVIEFAVTKFNIKKLSI